MSKYVIKNCDNYTNFDEDWTCRSTIQNRKGCYCCQDITDCVMKKIVELCKEEENIENVETLYDAAQSGIFLQSNRILKLLEIEESNNGR